MIRWLTAFIDLPADVFDRGARFWQEVTDSTRSAVRGAAGEFATLIPPDGDPYLRVQRVDQGSAGIHLDVHVDDPRATAERAVAAGATVLADRGHIVMASPGGFVFCLVEHHGEAVRPGPVDLGGTGGSSVDQLSIDVPGAIFEREVAFWRDVTGWGHRTAARDEFQRIDPPRAMPLQFLMQRLGADDGRTTVTAHLDIACGENAMAVRERHTSLGATFEHDGHGWTTMRDPTGMPYCLTERRPNS